LPRTKTFEGTVLDVQLIDGFIDHLGEHCRYWKNSHSDILGYDNDGNPIIDEYIVAGFRVTLVNPQGEAKTFKKYGRLPEIGSQQSYREAA